MKTIEYKVSFEKMVSRIPGLFAYLDWDEYGEASLHKATDSLDGCWGKIVENIKLPSDVALTIKKTHVITFEDVINQYIWLDSTGQKHVAQESDIDSEIEEYYFFLKSDEVYSYRTIIDYYYQYKDILGKNDPFIVFVENGIGKILVPEKAVIDGVELNIKGKATPKYIYLSNVKSLYNQLVKMKKMCDFYYNKINGISDWCNNEAIYTIEEKDKHLCCLCDKYCKMGGDAFKEYVGSLIPTAETIANEYYGYAENAENGYENEDIKIEPKPLTLDFDIDLTSTYQDLGILTPYAPIWLPYKRYKVGDKVEYDGELYECTVENTGWFDKKSMKVVFDTNKFKRCCSEFIDEKTNSISKTIDNVGDIWYDGECIKHIAQNRDVGRNVTAYNLIQTDEKCNLVESIKIGDVTDTDSKIMTDSKLVNMRRFVTYYNDDGVAERPKMGTDWLFYYRMGVVVNISTINDDLGNVISYTQAQNGIKQAATRANDLMAYGDVIERIDTNPSNHTIKFTYRIGIHLNATAAPTSVIDNDGNILYKWDKFIWDRNDKIGTKYVEEYNYEEGSDLDKLINNDFRLEGVTETFNFSDYIDGKYDKQIPTFKFDFITINNTFEYDKTIAHQDVNIVSLLTNFEIYRNDFNDFTLSDTFREDFFNGITYRPTKNIDVHIERGTTSVFDKHIAFGEIKTLEDMEQHSGKNFSMNIS